MAENISMGGWRWGISFSNQAKPKSARRLNVGSFDLIRPIKLGRAPCQYAGIRNIVSLDVNCANHVLENAQCALQSRASLGVETIVKPNIIIK